MTFKVFAAAAMAAMLALPLKAVELWEVEGLDGPESALPDESAGIAYVSNLGGGPTEKDGNGFISKISLDGKIVALKWATGLNSPKGLARVGDRLYAADIDRLVEINLADGKIVATYPANGAGFLNDAAADGEGRIYVSDMAKNVIWRLADGIFEPWLESEKLGFPNGLLVQGDKLIVASWGVMADEKAGKPGAPACLVEVSLADRSVRPLGSGKPVGNLDGIEPLGPTSYLVTDWVAGALYRIEASGGAELILDFNQGSADLAYLPKSKTALIPLMKDNKLVAYRIE